MSGIGGVLLRCMVILAGFLLASLAGSVFLHLIFAATFGFQSDGALAAFAGSLVFSVPLIALFGACFSFLPALPAIAIAEMFGLRGWLYFALAGGAVAAVVAVLLRQASVTMYSVSDAVGPPPETPQAAFDPGMIAAIVASGIVGGLAYWLVAGRRSGLWRVTAPARSGS